MHNVYNAQKLAAVLHPAGVSHSPTEDFQSQKSLNQSQITFWKSSYLPAMAGGCNTAIHSQNYTDENGHSDVLQLSHLHFIYCHIALLVDGAHSFNILPKHKLKVHISLYGQKLFLKTGSSTHGLVGLWIFKCWNFFFKLSINSFDLCQKF